MPIASETGPLPLPTGDVLDVWSVRVSEMTPRIDACEANLSAEERQRAARFVRPEDRLRSIVSHGILRELVGRYLLVAPASVEFVTHPFGKPALKSPTGNSLLSFNLAHSGDVIVCGFAGGRRVGIDVEALRSDFDVLDLARNQFSARETEALLACSPSERAGAFFRCWTRKEAYLKARGEGLGFPLKEFAVSFGPNEGASILWAADDALAPERWSMFNLEPAPGYAGAVVVEGRSATLNLRRCT